jgi:hypothetical protein
MIRFKDFKPDDMVAGVINTAYHQPNRPHFDAIELKGGGDAEWLGQQLLGTAELVHERLARDEGCKPHAPHGTLQTANPLVGYQRNVACNARYRLCLAPGHGPDACNDFWNSSATGPRVSSVCANNTRRET